MSTWRMAGLNYVNYSNIAARTLRKSLKSDLRDAAAKRDESHIRCFFWENGQMLPVWRGDFILVPMVLGPGAHRFFKSLCELLVDATLDQNAGFYLAQRISIAVQPAHGQKPGASSAGKDKT